MAVIGLGCLVALSLSLAGFETATHLRDEPWKLPALLSLGLLIRLIRSERVSGEGLHRNSALWVLAAVSMQVYAAAVGWEMGYRLALGLGGVGFLQMARLATLPSSLLFLFAVPPPTLLAKATHPELTSALAHLSTTWMPEGAYLPGMASGFALPLRAGDGGWLACWLAAAVVLYAFRVRAHQGAPRPRLSDLLALGLVGITAVALVQILSLAAASQLAGAAGSEVARGFLNVAPGVLIVFLGVMAVEIGLRRTPAGSPRPSESERVGAAATAQSGTAS